MANKTNPTSRKGIPAHGDACRRLMHVATSHIGRYHRKCKATSSDGFCTITAGHPKPK